MEFRYDFIISLDTVSGFEITFEKWWAKIFASEPRYSKVSIAGGVSDQALQPPSPLSQVRSKGESSGNFGHFWSKLFKTLCQTYFMGKHSPFFLSTRYSKSIGQGSLVSYHWVMKLVKMDLVLIKMELRHQQLILSTNLSNDYNSSLGNAVLSYDVKIKWANGNHRFW